MAGSYYSELCPQSIFLKRYLHAVAVPGLHESFECSAQNWYSTVHWLMVLEVGKIGRINPLDLVRCGITI